MAKKNKRKRAQPNRKHEKLFYMCFLIAMGYLPNQRASIQTLRQACQQVIVETSPTPLVDPEIPDNIFSIMLPILYNRRGLTVSDVKVVLLKMRELQLTADRNSGILLKQKKRVSLTMSAM